jgi:hypothetical protein
MQNQIAESEARERPWCECECTRCGIGIHCFTRPICQHFTWEEIKHPQTNATAFARTAGTETGIPLESRRPLLLKENSLRKP